MLDCEYINDVILYVSDYKYGSMCIVYKQRSFRITICACPYLFFSFIANGYQLYNKF